MRALTRALGFLSVLPLGALANFETAQMPGMLAAFPLAGALLGASLGLFWHLCLQCVDAQVAAALSVGAWALLTRALHLDGCADCADGLGGAYTPEARLKIMKDPHVGVFGTVAIFAVLLIKYTALASLSGRALFVSADPRNEWVGAVGNGSGWLSHVVLLALVFSAARFALLCGACKARYARKDGGLGRDFLPAVKGWVILAGGVVPLALVLLWGWERGIALAGVPVALALLLRAVCDRALGGQTGDTLGAMVELGEMGALVAALVRI